MVELVSNSEGKQKTPFEAVWGVNPSAELRIIGVIGAGLHADASTR